MSHDNESSQTTRRALLGTLALGATGWQVNALATSEQNIEPDGYIITYPDCQTALIEGTQWDTIQYRINYYDELGGIAHEDLRTEPDDDGVTEVSTEDDERIIDGYISSVNCVIEGGVLSRDNPNSGECDSQIHPDTTTNVESKENHIVIFGGGGSNKIEYEFTVTGEIEPSSSSEGAPIEDKYVSFNSEGEYRDSIRDNRKTVHGWVAGGGDAYRFSGEIDDFEMEGDAEIYVNGDRKEPNELSANGAGDSSDIEANITLRPERAEIEIAFSIPANVQRAKVVPYNNQYTVIRREGFDSRPAPRWDRQDQTPSIVLRLESRFLSPPETNGVFAREAPLKFGWWAGENRSSFDLFPHPSTNNISIANEDLFRAGEWWIYVGEHREYTQNVNGETLHMVVPEEAELQESPDIILNSLVSLSEWLGEPHPPDVLMFVNPYTTEESPGGRTPLARTSTEFWLTDSYTLSGGAWFHEYIHVRQSGMPFWFGEASAEYFETIFSYEQGYISRQRMMSEMRLPENSPHRDAILSNVTPSDRVPAYEKGQHVLYVLDQKIQSETDDDRSLLNVFRRMNNRNNTTFDGIKQIVAEISGTSMDEWLDEYVTTSAIPPFPDEQLTISKTSTLGETTTVETPTDRITETSTSMRTRDISTTTTADTTTTTTTPTTTEVPTTTTTRTTEPPTSTTTMSTTTTSTTTTTTTTATEQANSGEENSGQETTVGGGLIKWLFHI